MSKIHILDTKRPSFISKRSHTFIALLDGAGILTLDEFYTAISKALNFPDYFGRNLDALEEMLSDLGWIEQNTILLIVKNPEELFKGKSKEGESIMALIEEVENPNFVICFV